MKNLGQMMKQAQEMQAKMMELQESLADKEVEGVAAAGMVRVTMNCKGQIRRIKIDPSLVDPEDVEVLEDLILASALAAGLGSLLGSFHTAPPAGFISPSTRLFNTSFTGR